MEIQDVKERIRDLSGGSKDKDVLVRVANQLKDENVNPRVILKAIKEETGVGLSLRTTFKRDRKAAGDSALTGKASKVVERKVQDEIVYEAKERIEKVLRVGKTTLNQMTPLAQFHGYQDVGEFISVTYNFWDLYHDDVPKVYQENELLKATIRGPFEKFSPEAKRILLLNKMSELMQVTTMLHMMGGHFPPPGYMFEIRKIYLSILYDELEFETSAGKVKLIY